MWQEVCLACEGLVHSTENGSHFFPWVKVSMSTWLQVPECSRGIPAGPSAHLSPAAYHKSTGIHCTGGQLTEAARSTSSNASLNIGNAKTRILLWYNVQCSTRTVVKIQMVSHSKFTRLVNRCVQWTVTASVSMLYWRDLKASSRSSSTTHLPTCHQQLTTSQLTYTVQAANWLKHLGQLPPTLL